MDGRRYGIGPLTAANTVPPCMCLQSNCLRITVAEKMSSFHAIEVSRPPFQRCQYIRISVIRPASVSQKIAPRASTHSPVRRRRNTHLNSVENQGPAANISPELKVISEWL